MALGGGAFLAQNKKLPGSYINFVSRATGSAAISDRGVVTLPLELDWGPDDEVFTVENGDFLKNSMKYFGYDYASDKLKGLRDVFMSAVTLHAYRLNGGGEKASNTFATAKYSGTRGNALKVAVAVNVDDSDFWDVDLYMDSTRLSTETVKDAKELSENDYVVWNADAALKATAGTPLTGGTNAEVTGNSYQKYINAIESYTYNAMGVVTTDDTVKSLFVAFCKRMRDEVGAKFQLVLHQYTKADYWGVVSVENICTDGAARNTEDKMVYPDKAALVYWVTGLEGGIAVNKSAMNTCYAGEYTVDLHYTQKDLENAIDKGQFILHKVDGEPYVLEDINTFVSVTDTMGKVFQSNQQIHVCDQIAIDTAYVFNHKYSGRVPNDASGRVSLWMDIVKLHEQLQDIRAIQNFTDTDIVVEQGDAKDAVVVTEAIDTVGAMGKLYMTVAVI